MCGMIKARGCADGCEQREKITKQESASPTVATKSVFLTAVVDANEKNEWSRLYVCQEL